MDLEIYCGTNSQPPVQYTILSMLRTRRWWLATKIRARARAKDRIFICCLFFWAAEIQLNKIYMYKNSLHDNTIFLISPSSCYIIIIPATAMPTKNPIHRSPILCCCWCCFHSKRGDETDHKLRKSPPTRLMNKPRRRNGRMKYRTRRLRQERRFGEKITAYEKRAFIRGSES